MESHPKPEQISSFVEGRLDSAQARAVMVHLLHGCAECTVAAQRFFKPPRNLPEGSYDAVFDRACARIQEHLTPVEPPRRSRPVEPTRVALMNGLRSPV